MITFNNLRAKVRQAVASSQRTTPYDDRILDYAGVNEISHPLLSEDGDFGETAILPPVEPTLEEEREFLGELSETTVSDEPPLGNQKGELPTDEELDCMDLEVDQIFEGLGDGSYMAPEPIDEDFELLGPVEEYKELELIYRAFRIRIREKTPILGLRMEGWDMEFQERNGECSLYDPTGDIIYQSESTHTYEWSQEHDVLFWITPKGGEVNGYVLNGWAFKLKE